MLGGSEGGVSNVEGSKGVVIGLGSKVDVVLGVDCIGVGGGEGVVSGIKGTFGGLDVVEGNVVGVLGIFVCSLSVSEVVSGLGELVLGSDLGGIGGFEGSSSVGESGLSDN